MNGKKVRVSSYIAQYPIIRIPQSGLHFSLYSLEGMFNQIPFRLLWETSSHVAVNNRTQGSTCIYSQGLNLNGGTS